jgi:hypothetical protein
LVVEGGGSCFFVDEDAGGAGALLVLDGRLLVLGGLLVLCFFVDVEGGGFGVLVEDFFVLVLVDVCCFEVVRWPTGSPASFTLQFSHPRTCNQQLLAPETASPPQEPHDFTIAAKLPWSLTLMPALDIALTQTYDFLRSSPIKRWNPPLESHFICATHVNDPEDSARTIRAAPFVS